MRLPGRCLAVGALLAAAASGCGSDSTPVAPQTFNIHTAGDSVALLGGLLTIVVPPGGVSEDGNITVTALSAGSVPSSPLLVGNSAVEIAVSPATLQLLQPVTVRLSYGSLSLPSGVRGAELRLNTVVGGAWQPLPGGTNEAGASTVTASVTSFGDFGILGLPVAALVVSPPTISLAPGATQSITATPKDSLGGTLPSRAVTFTSSDPTKVTVAASGLVTGVAAGTATITVASETKSMQVPVTIAQGGVSTSQSTITVSAASVASGGTVTLTLQAKDGAGSNLTTGGLTVAFTTSGGTSTGTIGSTTDHANGTYTAVFTAGTAGTATTIHATIGGAAVTSTLPTITVTPGAASTSRSTIAVSAATVVSGGTVTLTLQAKDAAGNNLTTGGLTVAFTTSGGSSTGTIGSTTDHANGTYTAVFTAGTAGTATTIHATIGGAAVTSTLPTITVTTTVAGECASPQTGWIWCDDFESDRLSSYFEYDNAGGDFVRAASVGRNGSYGMRARWSTTGQVGAGSLHLAFGKTPDPTTFRPVDAGTLVYRDIYWRMYVRTQPGWTGGSAVKLSRAIAFANANWAEAMIAHVWGDDASASPYLDLDPVRGTDVSGNLLTTTYNDFNNFTWLGLVHGSRPLFANNQAGNWFCVEAHAKLNDAGQSNGVFETWINDTLDARASGLNFLGSYSAFGINAVFFENYWNAGAAQPEERYFDNLVVSTQRIGC